MSNKSTTELPYQPALINRITAWVDTLPGPRWAFYLGLFILIGLILNVAVWIEGSLPWGTFNLFASIGGIWAIESLFYSHYLISSSKKALDEFRPLLDISPAEFDKKCFEFVNVPLKKAIIWYVLGAALGAWWGTFLESLLDSSPHTYYVPRFFLLFTAIFGTALFMEFTYRVIYQLIFVRNLYATIPKIKIHEMNPIYALSKFTAKCGLVILLFLYVNPMYILAPGVVNEVFFIITFGPLSLVPLAAFILPLLEVNQAISTEKENLLNEIGVRIEDAKRELYRRMDSNQYQDMAQFQRGIMALFSFRDDIENTPTWPWKPETLRWLLTALILPLGLWIIQYLIQLVTNS